MSDARPITDAARNGSENQIRRNVRICQRMRTDSAHDGGSSSVAMTASLAPAARRSWWPRPGSRSRMPSTTNTIEGITNTKNGTRHPKASARTPPTTGPMKAPSALPMRWNPKTSARTSTG